MAAGWDVAAVTVVATVTTTTRRPAPRKTGRGRGRPPARPTRGQAASRSGPGARLGAGIRGLVQFLAGLERETWGVVLLVAGGLCGLGIYVGWTGPFGRPLRGGTRGLVGWGRALGPRGPPPLGAAPLAPRPGEG